MRSLFDDDPCADAGPGTFFTAVFNFAPSSEKYLWRKANSALLVYESEQTRIHLGHHNGPTQDRGDAPEVLIGGNPRGECSKATKGRCSSAHGANFANVANFVERQGLA
jgi:hypothetical protein